jgi:hypothetical protein
MDLYNISSVSGDERKLERFKKAGGLLPKQLNMLKLSDIGRSIS